MTATHGHYLITQLHHHCADEAIPDIRCAEPCQGDQPCAPCRLTIWYGPPPLASHSSRRFERRVLHQCEI
jgi:hypothetical protein